MPKIFLKTIIVTLELGLLQVIYFFVTILKWMFDKQKE